MASHAIRMPDVGEGVTEAEIVTWHFKVGDRVEEDEDLVDVMTDKATVEIPSPVSGIISKLNGAPGDMIAVGSEIIVIETEDGATETNPPKADTTKAEVQTKSPATHVEANAEPAPTKQKTPEVAASVRTPQTNSGEKPLASPAVRQRAVELDIDLGDITGTGPASRILREDLNDFIAAGGRAIAKMPAGNGTHSKKTGRRETKVIGLRRKIAQNMEAAWSVPMITYVEEIDVTEVEALRKTLNSRKSSDQTKLTLLPFLARALVLALASVPHANAQYKAADGLLTEFDGVHLGIATATDNGLVVPVLRHAESLSIWETAAEIKRISEAARDGKASRDELSGSTITITSLGAMGGIVTTPIINPPETAIIGVNKISERPVFDGQGRVVPRLFMNLSSSFDHRIVDGYEAATLIQTIRQYLETPATLFI